MDSLAQIKLDSLMNIEDGRQDIIIGVLDGPIDVNHPAFQGSRIRTVKDSQLAACKNASDLACIHGTFVAGILCAKRGISAPAICPNCEIVLNPIFRKKSTVVNTINSNSHIVPPAATPEELSNAIIETIDAGAKIINLSIGLSSSSLAVYDKLQQAYDYALQKSVIIVVAAGNQGNIGNVSLIKHQWLIPVAACDENGRLDLTSNFGPSIGNRGLMAPGVNILSTYPGGHYTHMSGTSFAAPFVTGAMALLWSLFPMVSAGDLINAVRTAATSNSPHRSIIPPLLNVMAAYNVLQSTAKTYIPRMK
jgi:subtilisin family serine protease